MARRKKQKKPPKTIITFEIDDEVKLNAALKRVQSVTVTARRGELGYVSNVEMADFATDMLPVIKHINTVFFHAEVDGLPQFPDLTGEPEGQPAGDSTGNDNPATTEQIVETGPAESKTTPPDGVELSTAGQAEAPASDGDYSVALYGPDDSFTPEGEQAHSGQAVAHESSPHDQDGQLGLWQ